MPPVSATVSFDVPSSRVKNGQLILVDHAVTNFSQQTVSIYPNHSDSIYPNHSDSIHPNQKPGVPPPNFVIHFSIGRLGTYHKRNWCKFIAACFLATFLLAGCAACASQGVCVPSSFLHNWSLLVLTSPAHKLCSLAILADDRSLKPDNNHGYGSQ